MATDTVADLREELKGKRLAELTPWQKLLNGLLWCTDNHAYGITGVTVTDLLHKALALRDPGWTPASTPPQTSGTLLVWVKDGFGLGTDVFVDGRWQNFGDDVLFWRLPPEAPLGQNEPQQG